jgi:Mn2+/Fe2+ NRAMP family transporter
VLNGVLLPVIMIFMLKLINKHELMGKHTNSTWFNWVAWATAAIVIGLSLVMVGNNMLDQWHHMHDALKKMHGG